MSQSFKMLICVSAGLALCIGARARVADSSGACYQGISERNAFGLKPPAQPRIEVKAPPLPKLILTGITTILGDKRALMKAEPPGAKAGDHSKELSLILTEGQREGDIEVLQIDENAGSVKVNNSGTVMTLTFDKDGPKPPNTPPPGLPSTAATRPPTSVTNFPTHHHSFGRGGDSRMRSLPTRTPRPPSGGPASPAAAGAASSPAADQASGTLSPQEEAILQEVQRELSKGKQNAAATPPVPGLPTGAAVGGSATVLPGSSVSGTASGRAGWPRTVPPGTSVDAPPLPTPPAPQ